MMIRFLVFLGLFGAIFCLPTREFVVTTETPNKENAKEVNTYFLFFEKRSFAQEGISN